jgi:hypothetical protein
MFHGPNKTRCEQAVVPADWQNLQPNGSLARGFPALPEIAG